MTDVLERVAQLSAPPVPSRHTEPRQPITFDPSRSGRALLATLSAAAGVIHLVMVPSHWGESVVEGLGFAAVGWFQLAVAWLVFTRPSRGLLRLMALANCAFIGAWAWSRVFGLPFGAHAGHAETVGFVDGTAVGLEAALVVASVLMLLRPGLGRHWSRSALGFATVIPLAVVVLATAAIASPGARDHASGSHGEHGAAAAGHSHAASADESGLAALENGHQHGGGEVPLDNATQAALSAQLAQTSKLVERYPTIAAAEAAGYSRAGPFSPGLGTHYIGFGGSTGGDGLMGAEGPMFPTLIYDGLGPDAPIAGFMYMSFGGPDAAPEGFIGPNDHWHYHTNTCLVFKDGKIEAPLGADIESVTEEQCARYGGSLIENTGYMVHVWTVPGYESPRGVFSNINPKLTCPDGTYHAVPLDELGYRTSACRNTSE